MSKYRDKVVESLPENLLYNPDSGEICSNQILCSNTTWGPFDVDKSPVDLNSTNSLLWSNIGCAIEWVNFLIENSIQKLAFNMPDEDCNVKIIFTKKELQVLVSTTKELEFNSELKCGLTIVDQLPSKSQPTSDLPVDSDQSNEKMTKTCKYCGINFSHQFTLEAHMTYYCSRRQNTMTEVNNGPKFQKTWRTRQRNKQSTYSKINSNDGASFKFFCDEASKLKNIDRNVSSKIMMNSAFNNSDTNQLENQLNLNSNPLIINSSVNKKSILQPTILSNGTNCNSNNLNNKTNESEKNRNHTANNSDSEPENGTSVNLFFCAPCGLFFSSKDLYNIHLQLDSTTLQLSAAKCNSLVLAAPLINNNGIQYVPIHPRTAVLNPLNNNSVKLQQHYKPNNFEDPSAAIPLDLSMNNTSSKSPMSLSNDRVQIDVASRIAAAAVTLGLPNCNQMMRSNKRPFLCPHCQTRFQLYSTFQAHQEFYCQGKRQQTDISTSEKRSRTASNNSGPLEFDAHLQKNDDGNWNICNQGFKCNSCGFIGQTKRGIRIHCKNQCFKNKLKNHKSDNKSEDIEVCSPTDDHNNILVSVRSPENIDFYHEDSPVKIEPV